MSFQEKIIEGKYNYFQKNQIYCEEHFKVFKEEKRHGNFTFNAELLSRVDTGEFLKIYVDYELTNNFEPLNLRVKRSLGGSKSSERFSVDLKDKKISYAFNGKNGFHENEKVVTGKFHIASPAFCSSMLMTQARKIDPVHRTAYDIVSSSNIWTYEEPFHESMLHVELMKLEPVTIELQGNEVQASHCNIYEEDKLKNPNAAGYPLYVSKHYQIPYMAQFQGGIRVEVESLKNYESEYSKMFR
ncbi:MAG: hypothetical protein WEB87_05610 [Bacteriovoracaceae bacterium]